MRLYSIAASRYGDEFDGKTTSLCVRRATYWCPELKAEDPAKKGLCSNFLCDAKPGDEIEMTGPTGAGARAAFAGLAPSSDFQITSNGGGFATQSMFSWAQTGGISPGNLSVTLDALPLNGLLAAATLASWFLLSLWLIGRHRWLDWWWRPRRAHRRRRGAIGDEQVSEEVAS